VELFRRTAGEPALDPDERSPETGLKFKDLLVLGQLMQAGARLREPRHAVYYLYVGSRDAADEMAQAARARAFTAEVREPLPQYPGQWSVVCDKHGVVLDPATVRDHDDFFEWLALTHGGEFDGWEASV
jgi:hypothetical protein